MNFRYSMLTLCFDVTRLCNMACDFCARGHAQNETITPDIVDATFENVKGVYVYGLRLSGGEPFLSPDMVAYIVDSMIRHNTIINHITVFTNATIIGNPIIDTALIKAANYLDNLRANQLYPDYQDTVTSVYDIDGRVNLILSDYGHMNELFIDRAYSHYNALHPKIKAVKQTLAYKGKGKNNVLLYGLAIENADRLLEQPITADNVPPVNDNHYNFIRNPSPLSYPPTPPDITKSITVSTNGTVFIGCMKDYQRVDAEAEFDIRNGDLYDYLDEYCWRFPATIGMAHLRRKILALQLCKAKGLDVDCDLKLESYLEIISFYETIHHNIHSQFPELPRLFISIRALIELFNAFENSGIDKSGMEILSRFAVGYTKETRELLQTKEGRQRLAESYNNLIEHAPEIIIRNYEKYIQNQIQSVFYILQNALSLITKGQSISMPISTYAADKKAAAIKRAQSPRLQKLRAELAEDYKNF